MLLVSKEISNSLDDSFLLGVVSEVVGFEQLTLEERFQIEDVDLTRLRQ